MPVLKDKTCAICGAPSTYSGKYAACPECAFKIHKAKASDFSQKYQDKEFLEVLKRCGGDNFGSAYEAAIEKVKSAHQKSMSNPKLNSSCCICGSPCHKFKAKYSTCVECALKVFKKEDPKISKATLNTQRKLSEATGGEDFTAKYWGKFIEQVKADYAPAPKPHFDCVSSPRSVCDHAGVPEQKNYLVKGTTTKNVWEEVRLCQDHYDKRIENGWLNSQWQALSDKAPKLENLKKGQRVEFEILAGDDKGYRGWATVIQDGTDNAYIYWDLPNKTSWATNGSRLEAVKELGLKPEGKNVWACFPDQLKVLRAFQPMDTPKPEVSTPPAVATKLSDLKKGQRVQLQGKSRSTKGLVGWAVVIKDGAKPVVYWEDKAPTGAWEGEHNHGAILRQYGLDPLLQRCWYCYDDDIEVLQVEDIKPQEEAKSEKVIALDLKDFKEGQRLKITHRKGQSAEHTTWATVVIPKGSCKYASHLALLYFDEEGGASWKDLSSFPDDVEAQAAAGRLGLNLNAKKFRYCKEEDTVILEKAPEIKIKDLEVGDRLHVYLECEKHYTWATVVVGKSSNPILHLDNPAKGADGKNIALSNSISYNAAAREYGLPEGAYYWGILEGCQTKILAKGKKLEKVKAEPPKDAFADFKEGDRLKIQHEGHTTWATVVQEGASYSGSLLLYYDTPSFDSYPRDSKDAVASCKKLGLDPTKKNFRKVLSASTTILEKAPAIVPQELQVGDRVQVEARNKDAKHLTWATVIKTGFYPVLHVDIQVPESIGSGSWRDSDHDMVAKTLGLPTGGKHYWTAYSDQIQFLTKAGSYLPLEKSKPKLSDCKVGERIQVEYLSKTSWATVVLPEGQDTGYGTATVLYFDPPGLQGWRLDADKSTHKHLFPAAENLGLDATQRLFRRCYGDDTKVLERRSVPALKDLKQGDRVYVSIKDKIKTWATVIRADTTPVLHLDTVINESFGKSWDSEYWDANVAVSYGLKAGTSNYWTATDTSVQILTQGMSLPKVEISNVASEADKQEKEPEMKTKYRVGEKLRIKIEWHDKELDAHVIETDDNDTILWLEDKSGCGWKPTRKATVEAVQRLGLGRGAAMNCYTMDDEVKIVKRYDQISEETKKGEEDMSKRKWKVGDRVKIKTTSSYPFTGWGTIISLKGLDGDPNQPLLFMDEEQDDTWPWDEESQRKAAIKAGLDPEKASFWWLCEDDDTEVLEKEEEKMEEKNFMGMVKSDAVEAGYRVASTQMTKGVKAGLLRMFKDKGADAGKLVIVQELLDSEVGSAVIALIMGHGMGYIPKLNEDPRFQKLAKEFRIGGMSTAGNVLMDTVMQYLAPAVMDAVGNLPPVSEVVSTVSEKAGIKKKTKKRIAPVVRVKDAPKLEEHEEEESKKEALAATG